MGTTYKLTDYLNRIENYYREARMEYEEAVSRLKMLDDKHQKVIDSNELNSVGLHRENERYLANRKEIIESISNARNDFRKNASEVRESVNVLFKGNYVINTEDIDMKAVEVLKSGILTDMELLELANTYKAQGNLAMYRYCGTFANEKDNDLRLKNLALSAKQSMRRDDLMLIDDLTDICIKGLRDDVTLSNGIDREHEKFISGMYEAAEGITATPKMQLD